MHPTKWNKKQINNIVVEPIPNVNRDAKPDNDLFSVNNPNIYLLAKKQTGKTTVIYNILKEIADPQTMVIFFVSTFYSDKSYAEIAEYLKNKDVPYFIQTSFLSESDNNNNLDELENLMKYITKSNANHKKWEELDPHFIPMVEDDEEMADVLNERTIIKNGKKIIVSESFDIENTKLKKKEKEKPQKYIIVIDDMGTKLKGSSLKAFLKANDHMKATIIVSTQNKNDLPPECISQMQVVLAFTKIPEPKLKKLYEDLGLSIDYNTFKKLYADATALDDSKEVKKSKNFLYIDVDKNLFRKNFNLLYEL